MELADVPRHRPLAFDKMESLIKEMQEPESGVPVRSQKLFLTFIPSAFMGYDLVEWLMDRFNMDDNVEAINLANQLCQYGYFFPVNDSKNLILKDDSSLYRFQSPYYWPWAAPRAVGGASGAGCGGGSGASPAAPSVGSTDNLEYAIYLVKRTLRNKQRHGLEEYELEALANLKKNLAAKWDFITMQAEEQVRLAKDRKKGDKIVSDSQERAYWRVARPPPGLSSALESCPVPARARQPRVRRRTLHQLTKEVELLRASLDRTRVKVSIALEALLAYSETFAPWDPWLHPPQPSNPWVTDDTLFWQINSAIVETPTEKRIQRWTLSMEELVSDPTGLQEFTSFLRKEYSHENIRFWLAVMDLRRSSQRHIQRKLNEIYEEFLKPGAPCEINIDGATMERVGEALRTGSRFALDHAADHVYSLLLKKDCYPRFVRSEHFRILIAAGKNTQHKKRFFGFGGPVKKKSTGSQGTEVRSGGAGGSGALGRRRGSDRSLSGSAHELAVCAAQPPPVYTPHAHAAHPPHPPHSHSQSNLSDIPYSREPTDDESAEVLPWECAAAYPGPARRRKDSVADSGSSSSDVSGVAGVSGAAERVRRLPQQSTLDGGLRGAPPPLRRLSAVEPRHLAPLCSPPQSPHAPRAPAAPAPPPSTSERTMTAPQPTPTISVSSAPDDESLAEAVSPEEATSLSRECDPPSVFTPSSREASPPELSEATAAPHQLIEELDSINITVETCDVQSSRCSIEYDERLSSAAPTLAVVTETEPSPSFVSSAAEAQEPPSADTIPISSIETHTILVIDTSAVTTSTDKKDAPQDDTALVDKVVESSKGSSVKVEYETTPTPITIEVFTPPATSNSKTQASQPSGSAAISVSTMSSEKSGVAASVRHLQESGETSGVAASARHSQESRGTSGVAASARHSQESGGTMGVAASARHSQESGGTMGVAASARHSQESGGTSGVAASARHSQESGGAMGVAASARHSQESGGTMGVAASARHSQESGGTSGVAASARHSQESGGTSCVPASARHSQESGGTSGVAASTRHSQESGGTSDVAASARHSQESGGTMGVAASARHSQESGGTMGVAASARHSQESGGTSDVAASARHSQESGGTMGVAASARHSQESGGTMGVAASARHSQESGGTSGVAASARHSQESGGTSCVPASARHSQESGGTSGVAASTRHSQESGGTSDVAASARHSQESGGTSVAPLAECEDVGVEDDNVDKVPSVPQRRESAETQAPEVARGRECHADAQLNIVKNDNKSNTSEPSQRNDICPWEDENSCETDAPFVKTYATLGYL